MLNNKRKCVIHEIILFPNLLSRLSFLCYSSCTHACNIAHVLSKYQEESYSWENVISDGTFAIPTADCGQGKRRNEFVEWNVAWLGE